MAILAEKWSKAEILLTYSLTRVDWGWMTNSCWLGLDTWLVLTWVGSLTRVDLDWIPDSCWLGLDPWLVLTWVGLLTRVDLGWIPDSFWLGLDPWLLLTGVGSLTPWLGLSLTRTIICCLSFPSCPCPIKAGLYWTAADLVDMARKLN